MVKQAYYKCTESCNEHNINAKNTSIIGRKKRRKVTVICIKDQMTNIDNFPI